jgi:hypothetical protein
MSKYTDFVRAYASSNNIHYLIAVVEIKQKNLYNPVVIKEVYPRPKVSKLIKS